MIYLSKSSSFDIKFDNINHSLILGNNVVYKDVLEGTLDYIRTCLLNSELDVPIHLYRVYQNLSEKDFENCIGKDFVYDLLLMTPNVMGVEYVKTHGHRTPNVSNTDYSYPVIIEILYGAGTFLIQKFNTDFNPLEAITPEIEKIFMIKATKGSKVIIPPGYYYTMINTRNTYLATGMFHHKWDTESERERISEKSGFGYYVIRKNARQEVVLNPRYKNTPKLERIKPASTLKPVGYRSSKPVVEFFQAKPERFDFLTKPEKYSWDLV